MMFVPVWGRSYRVVIVAKHIKKGSQRAACMVRHRRERIEVSILVPRKSRAHVIACAVAHAWATCPRAARMVPLVA